MKKDHVRKSEQADRENNHSLGNSLAQSITASCGRQTEASLCALIVD